MSVIYKYDIKTDKIDEHKKIMLPKNAKVISVDNFCIYVELNGPKIEEELEERKFIAYATGQTMLTGITHKFIGTFRYAVDYVFHAYEIIEDIYDVKYTTYTKIDADGKSKVLIDDGDYNLVIFDIARLHGMAGKEVKITIEVVE